MLKLLRLRLGKQVESQSIFARSALMNDLVWASFGFVDSLSAVCQIFAQLLNFISGVSRLHTSTINLTKKKKLRLAMLTGKQKKATINAISEAWHNTNYAN